MTFTFDAEKLSREVKSKRLIQRELNLRQAAAEMGIGFTTLSRIENRKKPDIETLAAVCDWINCPMDMFFKRNK